MFSSLDDLEKREQGVRFTNLIEQVLKMNQPMDELEDVDLSKCQCAEILSSVFPQLVNHWRAAGNRLVVLLEGPNGVNRLLRIA